MAVCAKCEDPLVLVVDYDVEDDEPPETEEVPDDLELPCGCHFHCSLPPPPPPLSRQCLIDDAAQVALSLKCPKCQSYLPANQAGPSATNPIFGPSTTAAGASAIRTRYSSEGGVDDDYDILPVLTEEAYLASHPEARPARALLTMCAQGDVMGIVGLLQDMDGEDEDGDGDDEARSPPLPVNKLLRYQDPLGGMRSGLHVAVENNQEEAFFMLLFLASRLATSDFPAAVVESAQQVGLGRPEQGSDPDIRTLADDKGDGPEAYARKAGGKWAQWAEAGVFTQGL
ncbi:uncharacterized protein E0L32_000151 [Thyridium curvatum]|uniref:Uncharacterized protein n=1 Tax=Thyridium curvatum TaxID=1093900 RepID=A0A507B7P6_9PEZI|nr:uncharacterized protein E0L32_000151 [Thyridium curvatum]TPX15817.1 hypothetical protein E0L32_000151 [Thyridium curvatum]